MSPAKTSQCISRLLSAKFLAGTGLLGFAKESKKAHLHNTFQCSIPVRRFKVTSVSRERCETRMRSRGAFMIPKIARFDNGALFVLVEGECVTASDVRFKPVKACFVHFLVRRKQNYLMGRNGEIAVE